MFYYNLIKIIATCVSFMTLLPFMLVQATIEIPPTGATLWIYNAFIVSTCVLGAQLLIGDFILEKRRVRSIRWL